MVMEYFFYIRGMSICKILLVDDDLEDYQILKQAFADLGADESLFHAPSGREALAFLEKGWEADQSVPDIVVLDINMPMMNGIEVLRKMRGDNRFAKVPVVMYSNSIIPSHEAQCTELGVEYCISKPNRLEDIIQVGETLLALSHQRDPLTVPDIS